VVCSSDRSVSCSGDYLENAVLSTYDRS